MVWGVGPVRNGTMVKQWLYRDALAPVAELDGTGALLSRFVYGSNSHVPDYMIRSGVTYRILSDQLGSTRLIVNVSTGAIARRLRHDAWGSVLEDTNPDFTPFGFAGGLYDADTALVRFGARDYDPQVGRWMSKDPILFDGGQTNLYAYVGNDPINRTDETGEGPADCVKATARYLECKGKLDKRIEENECSPNGPDRGHDKAIEQRRNQCDELRRKAFNQCKDPSTR